MNDVMRLLGLLQLKKNNKYHLIIHTDGGDCTSVDVLSRLLSECKCKIYTYIPKYAYSAGSMLAICGDKIYMNWYSLMGPIDTQIDYDEDETFSAKYVKEFRKKSWAKDKEYLYGLEAEAIHNDDEFIISRILRKNNKKDRIIKRLLNTKYSHGISFTYQDIKEMGLPVINDVPEFIMDIFKDYKQLF